MQGGHFTASAGGKDFFLVNGRDVLSLIDLERVAFGFLGSDVYCETRFLPDGVEARFEPVTKAIGWLALATYEGKAEEVTNAARAGEKINVVTKYPLSLRRLALTEGLCLRDVYRPAGKVEAMLALGIGDAIYDIVQTGETLNENNMVVVQPGEPLLLGAVYKDLEKRVERILSYNAKQL